MTPPVATSKSHRLSTPAPALTMTIDPPSRAPSPGPMPLSRQEIEDIYSSGAYADPKIQKSLGGVGPALFTPAHRKLIDRFREECSRLYSHSRDLRDRAQASERRLKTAHLQVQALEHQNIELRQRSVEKSAQIIAMAEELREAQLGLAEMDKMFTDTRSKRLSRIQARATETLGEARAALQLETDRAD